MEGLIFVLVALVVGALGLGIGMLVAPRITRFADRTDEDGEDPAEPGPDPDDERGPGGRTADTERKDEPPGDDRA